MQRLPTNHKRTTSRRRRRLKPTAKARRRTDDDSPSTTICFESGDGHTTTTTGDASKTMLDFFSPGTTSAAGRFGTPTDGTPSSSPYDHPPSFTTNLPSFADVPSFADIPSCAPLPASPRTPPSPCDPPARTKTPPTAARNVLDGTPPTPADSNSTVAHKRRRTEPANGSNGSNQLYLDFGQASFGTRTVCPVCNSLYVHGVEEDEANHRRVCNEYAYGVVLALSANNNNNINNNGAWKNLRIVHRDDNDGFVVEVRPKDPAPYRKKALRVKAIVDREVGFVAPTPAAPSKGGGDGAASLRGKTAFLYAVGKRIVGFCTAEVISKGYRLLPSDAPPPEEHPPSTTPVRKPPATAAEKRKHYYRSTRPTRAKMGVHQIWTHRLHRRKGVARTLVDVARGKMVYGMTVPFDAVAFSSPTADGAAFAGGYSETEAPLVYDCR